MKFVVKALVNGFAFTIGALVAKKLAKHFGIGEEVATTSAPSASHHGGDAPSDSNLQQQYS